MYIYTVVNQKVVASKYENISVTCVNSMHQRAWSTTFKCRRSERLALTEVRYKSHLTYLHQCKDMKLLPQFLRSRPPIDHPQAWDIAENCHNNLRNISIKYTKPNKDVKRSIDEEKTNTLRQAITERCKYEANKISQRHESKLNVHKANKIEHEDTQKRWVIYTSKRTLDKHEITLLRNGMNFAITPKRDPIKDISASVERGIKDLEINERNEIPLFSY